MLVLCESWLPLSTEIVHVLCRSAGAGRRRPPCGRRGSLKDFRAANAHRYYMQKQASLGKATSHKPSKQGRSYSPAAVDRRERRLRAAKLSFSEAEIAKLRKGSSC